MLQPAAETAENNSPAELATADSLALVPAQAPGPVVVHTVSEPTAHLQAVVPAKPPGAAADVHTWQPSRLLHWRVYHTYSWQGNQAMPPHGPCSVAANQHEVSTIIETTAVSAGHPSEGGPAVNQMITDYSGTRQLLKMCFAMWCMMLSSNPAGTSLQYILYHYQFACMHWSRQAAAATLQSMPNRQRVYPYVPSCYHLHCQLSI